MSILLLFTWLLPLLSAQVSVVAPRSS